MVYKLDSDIDKKQKIYYRFLVACFVYKKV